jgi:regulator of cell morphogenesis and NO signaling
MTTSDNLLDFNRYTVADIALNFPQAIKVLHRYDLDYCCNGKKPFVQACEKAHLDSRQIWDEIVREVPYDNTRIKFGTWDANLLIDFILQHHHEYVRSAIPEIKELLEKVCKVHGADTPELLDVQLHFNALAEELLNHLPKEEQVLFPAIKKMASATSAIGINLLAHVQQPVAVMEHEHDRAGELIKLIRTLTNHYKIPEYACPTFQLTYRMLEEFDADLMQHIHLENNILFPKVKI